jgi:hypothetical protein
MTFFRLTLGFGVLGVLVCDGYGVIWLVTHSAEAETSLVSPGAQLFIAGFIGFFGGALLGFLVWAVWNLSRLLRRRAATR